MSSFQSLASAAQTPSQLSTSASPRALNPMTLGWVVRRAVLGALILTLAFGTIAWLTYASLDSDAIAATSIETTSTQ